MRAPTPPGITFKKARVLVVDDDERNLLALTEVLRPIAGVVTASSGRDALRQLLKSDFAVILLDVFMPGLDGYETAALIREREQTAHIPIIFLSAVNKETEHLMRGYAMGAVDYVFKPVDPVVLKSKVSVFVDLFRMRRQVEEQALAEQKLREANYREQLNRIETERQLEDSERRLGAILKALPLAIYEADNVDGRIGRRRFVGGDLARLAGAGDFGNDCPAGATIEWEDSIHPGDRKRAALAAPVSGEVETVEYRWIGSDGRTRYILDQRIPVGPGGRPTRWAGTLFDISERKQLEAQLLHAGKLDALGHLTGGVAHDFNNLLAAILGGLNILQRRIVFGEREQLVIDQMHHAARQGAELVRRMMAFARQQDLNPAVVVPGELCKAVAGLVDHTLGGKVQVDWHCPDLPLNLFVDRGQLELALMNLIINARDAMPDGGRIAVSVEALETSRIGGAALRIRVADEGVGIADEVLAKVTEPFFTTKESGKGTGLGLSMVSGFVHQSGGALEISSELGQGTSIDLILPATTRAAEDGPGDEGGDHDWLCGKRMLLVDDDESVRFIVSEMLHDRGGSVDCVGDGEAAIERITKTPDAYDFVLSDFAMPGLDGLATLSRIRAITPNLHLVLMTGYADETRLAQNDQFPLVRKPIDPRKLAEAFAPAG